MRSSSIFAIAKSKIVMGALSALFAGVLHTSTWAAAPAIPTLVEGEVLVAFTRGTPASTIDLVHRSNGGQVDRSLNAIGVQVVRINGSVDAALQAYRRNPNILYAEPNYLRPLILPSEGSFGPGQDVINEQWNLHNTGSPLNVYTDPATGLPGWQFLVPDADIDAAGAWDITTGSASIRVAVPDSGVDCNHGDLVSKCDFAADYVTPTTDSFGNPIPELVDQLGHGTHVAGIIAMETNNSAGGAGVGWNTMFGSFKVCYAEIFVGIIIGSACQDADIAAAIIDATDMGYNVISMSFGQTAPSAVLEDALNYAAANDVVLVAAAGNNNTWERVYPAAYEPVISVAASNPFGDRAGFSTFSTDSDDWVELIAPGDPIISTVPSILCGAEGSQCFGYKSGTSMAAPHVAGVAALLLDHIGIQDPQAVRDRLTNCADETGPLGQNMLAWSQYGHVNAAAALNCGGNPPPPPPPPTGAHIADLDAVTASSGGNAWTSSITVLVHSADEQPLTGVSVDLIADDGSSSTVASCVSDEEGQCATQNILTHKRRGTVTYTVQTISDASYDPAANHDSDDDSDGTVIVVSKP